MAVRLLVLMHYRIHQHCASIMHEGVMALLRRRGDEVFRCGEAEIEFNFSAKELQIEYQDETGEKLDLPENVVKIDFGKEQ